MPPVQPLSRQDAFARHGFPEGYPLWNPSPVLLPQHRQSEGLRIGDVGIIDRDGCFDTLFNICEPRDHVLEREHGFPTGFTRIKKPTIVDYTRFTPGHVFSSPETSWFSEFKDAPFFSSPSTLCGSRTITRYIADLSKNGAHIIVPQGAKSSKVVFQGHRSFESQANEHWSTWFDFARACRGPLCSLYLITGLCRTKSWALASFNENDDGKVKVTCELVEQDEKLQVDGSRWSPLGRFANGIGPSTDSQGSDNQTIFLQSFTITKKGIVRPPHPEQLASCDELKLTESSRTTDGESSSQDSDKTVSGSAHSGGGSGGVAHTPGTITSNKNSTEIHHTPGTTLPAHPSEIINRYLLMKQPFAEAAVTHDSAWMTMLARGQLLKLEDLESTIDAIVSEHYSIVSRNGVVRLISNATGMKRFSVNFDQSDLPIDLADCIQHDIFPYAQRPFGNIFKGSLHTTNFGSIMKVAVTIITLRSADGKCFSEEEMRAHRIAEQLAGLDQINVLPLIWAAIESSQFILVSPWAMGGTLTSYLGDMHSKLTNVQILTLLRDVAAGLHYLHSKDILHGYLSGTTVVIDTVGTALLSDFGLSTMEDEHGSWTKMGLELETVRWTAPESLRLAREDAHVTRNPPTKASDIYSFGCIMLQILSGDVPYHYYEDDEHALSAICKGETPRRPNDRRLTDHRWMFLQECWSPLTRSASASRYSSQAILEFVQHDLELTALERMQDMSVHAHDSALSLEQPVMSVDGNPGMPKINEVKLIHTLVAPVSDTDSKVCSCSSISSAFSEELDSHGPGTSLGASTQSLMDMQSTMVKKESQPKPAKQEPTDSMDWTENFAILGPIVSDPTTDEHNLEEPMDVDQNMKEKSTSTLFTSRGTTRDTKMPCPATICRWLSCNPKDQYCGAIISCESVPTHFRIHGIKALEEHEVIRCNWEACFVKISRKNLTRHICEVHLNHMRGKGH